MDGTDLPTTRSGERTAGPAPAVLLAAILAVLMSVGAVACSSSSDGDSPPPTSAASGEADDDGTETGDSPTEPGSDEAALTAEDICTRLPADAVAEATGLDITEATPSEGSTPQCAYHYPSDNGPDSNLTVAASRYTSSDAQTIEQAYDSAVQINITTAGGTDVDQTDVDAGDEAVILSGSALELGVLRVGDVLASLIIPPGAVSADQTQALMVSIGDAFA